jgi:transcriptional regulator with XRE-family HTH domain
MREQRRWTQRDLAAKSGVHQATVSYVERAAIRPDRAILEKIARAFGTPVEAFSVHARTTPAQSELAKLIAARALERGLDVRGVAKELDLDYQTAYRLLHKTASIADKSLLDRIVKKLGVPKRKIAPFFLPK